MYGNGYPHVTSSINGPVPVVEAVGRVPLRVNARTAQNDCIIDA